MAPATQEYMGKHGLTEAWDIEDFVSLSKTLKVPHQDSGRGGGSDNSRGTHEIIVEIVWFDFDLYFANNNFNVCLSPKYSTNCFHSWLNKPTYLYLPLPLK